MKTSILLLYYCLFCTYYSFSQNTTRLYMTKYANVNSELYIMAYDTLPETDLTETHYYLIKSNDTIPFLDLYENFYLKIKMLESKSQELRSDSTVTRERFYRNGKLKELIHQKNGVRLGHYTKFHENGYMKEQGVYSYPQKKEYIYDTIQREEHSIGITTHIKSEKDKIWEYYNEKGLKIRTEIWNKGVLLKREDE